MHPGSDNGNIEGNKESPSGASDQTEETEDITEVHLWISPRKPVTYHHQGNGTDVPLLGFTQTVAQKLVGDQGIDSPWTLASLSDDDITTICNVIKRPGLVSSNMPDKGEPEEHSVFIQNNGTLLQSLQHSAYQQHVILKDQHQWELKQKNRWHQGAQRRQEQLGKD